MTLKFHDVSHYQGDYHPVGPTIAKATEGTGFVDARYTTNRSRTLAGGWPFAGYHFLTTADATAQAKHAFAHIGATPAMLDVETGTSGNPSWAKVKAFVTAYRKIGGILHLAYIPKWYWRDHWDSPDMSWLDDNAVALISSQYTGYSDTGPGWDPYGGVAPTIWQCTSTPIDTNAFKGSQAELGRLFATGSTAAAPAPDVPTTGDDHMPLTSDDIHNVWHAPELADESGASAKQSGAGGVEKARDAAEAAQAGVAALEVKVDALTAKVDALPTTALPAGPISDADVARIAAAVVDLQAQRLES